MLQEWRWGSGRPICFGIISPGIFNILNANVKKV